MNCLFYIFIFFLFCFIQVLPEGRRKVPFKDQIKIMISIGIDYDKSINLLDIFDKKQYEEEPFILLLSALGSKDEKSDKYISNDIYYLDTECIAGNGSYKEIFENLMRISKNTLQVKNIEDKVDFDKNEAWIKFKLGKNTIKLNLEIDNDWMDPNFFNKLFKSVNDSSNAKNFYILYLEGQDLIVGYFDVIQVKQLRKYGIDFRK